MLSPCPRGRHVRARARKIALPSLDRPDVAKFRFRSIAPVVRVAVVHDWLDTWRGGESVLAQILTLYPEAELFALVDFLSPADRRALGGRRATTSYLQHVPFARNGFRLLLPLFPRAIESLDVAGFDLVISSSHAVAKGVRTHARQVHICYCYTPMRYAWDLREQYLSQTGLDRGLRSVAANALLARLRRWDRDASERVDHFVAISAHIAARIRRCYGRDATVIYPPVTVAAHRDTPTRGSSYLTVSQLVPYKRIDLLIDAFRRMPDRELVIVGDGPLRRMLQARAPANVRLLGRLSAAERDGWLARARAFVFAAEEDFGIAPLEAQAFGTPVIAYAGGAARETIGGAGEHAPAGLLFPEQSVPAIVDAVHEFERNAPRFTAEACRTNARRFGVERFRRELSSFVDTHMHADRSSAR
jgi:glycosyltransferase involved in cell wall biosynthesis